MSVRLDLESQPGVAMGHASGPMTLDDMKEAARSLWRSVDGSRVRVLWDLREAQFDISANDVRELAEWVKQESPFDDLLTAFVVRPGLQFGLARMFEMLREKPGARTGVFTEAEPALAWLRSESP